jgi:type II secretory pathway pseudopilin PulG
MRQAVALYQNTLYLMLACWYQSARRAAVRQERALANRKQLQQAQDERLQRHNERVTGVRGDGGVSLSR